MVLSVPPMLIKWVAFYDSRLKAQHFCCLFGVLNSKKDYFDYFWDLP